MSKMLRNFNARIIVVLGFVNNFEQHKVVLISELCTLGYESN
jgi:hypothetical protein